MQKNGCLSPVHHSLHHLRSDICVLDSEICPTQVQSDGPKIAVCQGFAEIYEDCKQDPDHASDWFITLYISTFLYLRTGCQSGCQKAKKSEQKKIIADLHPECPYSGRFV